MLAHQQSKARFARASVECPRGITCDSPSHSRGVPQVVAVRFARFRAASLRRSIPQAGGTAAEAGRGVKPSEKGT
eukprot:13230040-Alexandrium_andersonii.AAC.1